MSDSELSTSPSSVASILNVSNFFSKKETTRFAGSDDESSKKSDSFVTPIDLREFIRLLPDTIRKAQKADQGSNLADEESLTVFEGERNTSDVASGVQEDHIAALFRRLDVTRSEWERFEFFDPTRNYTRNLISTDGDTYTLILLCWNAGKESPIHDHPCDGCWMRILEGSVRECRYVQDKDEDKLVCIHDELYREGDMAYIKDSMGYHKVGNPTKDVPAVTMHLYSPPFQCCKIWLDPAHASQPSNSRMCYYSNNGRMI